jgi:uncharacterized protein
MERPGPRSLDTVTGKKETGRGYPTVMNRRAALVVAVTSLFLALGCGQERASADPDDAPSAPPAAPAATAISIQTGVMDETTHAADVAAWKTRRAERLQAEDGWLSLVGLHWLTDGENKFGSLRTNTHVLPATAPAEAGRLRREGDKITLEPVAPMTINGQPVTGPVVLADDSNEAGPTIVQMGTYRFQVIKRGDRLGLRVKDSAAPTRTKFEGLEYFAVDPRWRVEARYEEYSPQKKIPIADVTGMMTDSISPGALVFTIDGKEHRLDPILEEGTDDLFIIFRDQTSADSTYPAGRYVYAAKPGPDGKVYIDFNKAYNPPCAFTAFATCPLPPMQNRLPLRVEAGEKKYAGAH